MAHATASLGPTRYVARFTRSPMTLTRAGLFLAAHVPLAFLLSRSSTLATLHALTVFGLGLWWVLNGQRNRAAYAGAYIVGAEVLWRMTEASIPWEFGKYGLSFILMASLIRAQRLSGPAIALFYFALLVPSVWLTVDAAGGFSAAREGISFNLSGPFALFICAWFFRHTVLTSYEMRMVFLALIGPILGVMFLAQYGTVAAYQAVAGGGESLFSGESNFATSGGYGPNQVSSVLGLAALLGFFYLIMGRATKGQKALMAVFIVLLAGQSALTFSRSGLALAIAAGVAASFFLVQRARTRLIIVSLATVSLILISFVIIPRLNDFTGGAFADRFTDTSDTGRSLIIKTDLRLWGMYPLLGVGPGRGTAYRDALLGKEVAAHTEYSRLLAEHGIFGLMSLVLLLVGCWLNVMRISDVRGQAIFAAFVTWALLFQLVNGFRLAAPALLIGMTFAPVWLNENWTLRVRRPQKPPEELPGLEH